MNTWWDFAAIELTSILATCWKTCVDVAPHTWSTLGRVIQEYWQVMVLVQLCNLAWSLYLHGCCWQALKETRCQKKMLQKRQSHIEKLENDLGWAKWRHAELLKRANERLKESEGRAEKAEGCYKEFRLVLQTAILKANQRDEMGRDLEEIYQVYMLNREEVIETGAALKRSLERTSGLHGDRFRLIVKLARAFKYISQLEESPTATTRVKEVEAEVVDLKRHIVDLQVVTRVINEESMLEARCKQIHDQLGETDKGMINLQREIESFKRSIDKKEHLQGTKAEQKEHIYMRNHSGRSYASFSCEGLWWSRMQLSNGEATLKRMSASREKLAAEYEETVEVFQSVKQRRARYEEIEVARKKNVEETTDGPEPEPGGSSKSGMNDTDTTY